MRAFVISLFALAALSSVSLAATPDSADSSGKDGGLTSQSMDQLFSTLAKPGDDATGKAVESELERRWRDSGSDTIELLMQWATEAIATKNFPRALDYLDAVTTMKPDYVEGWNRRATLFFLQDEYGKALSDLEKVLALEPRHYGALAGLGMILNEIDRKKEALLALKKAIAIDPYLDDQVRDAIKTLEPELDGREI
jgi:tetratricopeptide (TPR) repeat protein